MSVTPDVRPDGANHVTSEHLDQKLNELRSMIIERETSLIRATFTLFSEIREYLTSGQPISEASIKGLITAWLLPRTVLLLGSVLGAVAVGLQTYVMLRQNEILGQQLEIEKRQLAFVEGSMYTEATMQLVNKEPPTLVMRNAGLAFIDIYSIEIRTLTPGAVQRYIEQFKQINLVRLEAGKFVNLLKFKDREMNGEPVSLADLHDLGESQRLCVLVTFTAGGDPESLLTRTWYIADAETMTNPLVATSCPDAIPTQ